MRSKWRCVTVYRKTNFVLEIFVQSEQTELPLKANVLDYIPECGKFSTLLIENGR